MNINIQNAAFLILTLITAAFLTSPILVALILLFFVLPGLVLSRLLPFQNLPWEVKVILAVSIGIAAIPLVTWLLKIFSLPLLSLTVIAFVALFAFAAARGIRRISFTFERRWRGFELLLIALLFLSLLSRLFPVNTLQVPPFADPALQGMITRIMTDQGGIPDTWSPFLPIAFNHQPGFASIIAWFSLLSSLPIPKLILYLTNIFHALFPFSLYLLAYALSQNRPASLISAALALIAIFPTSLFVAGANATVLMYPLAIVAAGTAILFLHEDTKQKRNGDAADLPTKLRSGIRHLLSYWNVLTALVILFAGSMLIHPTFAVFFGLIFGLYTLFLILQHKLDFIGRYALRLLLVFLAALVAGAIVAPFFLHSTPNKQLLEEQWEIQAEYVNPQHTISPYFFVEPIFFLFDNPQGAWYLELEKLSLRELFTHSVGILLSALFLYSLFFIWKKKDTTGYFLATLYVLFLALSSFQSVFELHFPGWNLLYPSRIKFLMVLPVALLIAFPFFRQSMRGFNIRHALLSLPILIILLVTPYNLLIVSRNLNALASLSPFSKGDEQTISWISQNVPEGAVIFNSIRDVEAGVFIGGAGQWIPTLTGRNILFPALSLTEDVLDPAVAGRLLVMRGIEANLAGDENFLDILRSYSISYIFLSPSTMQTRRTLFGDIDPEQFLSSPFYKLEYQNENTYIFSILYPESP